MYAKSHKNNVYHKS